MKSILHQRYPALRARVGVSRWDITPALSVCAKNWGAATSWFANGVHRRLAGTALALAPLDEGEPPLLLIVLELGWWRSRKDVATLRQQLLAEFELPDQNLIVHLTHTHSGPALDSDAPSEARPDTARAYLARLSETCVEGGREALSRRHSATALFRYGRCALATQRDFRDPQAPDRFLCGFHPEGLADDTLLVTRLVADEGRTLATLVNYACHPTTLAWENTLISPDYPGAMRELVEAETDGAPCLFLLGAAGELAPAEQYVGDVSLADRHGRELGHAALATLAPLAAGHSALRFDGSVESGAPLAMWRSCAGPASEVLRSVAPTVSLPLKPDLPSIAAIDEALARKPDGFQYERLLRQRRVRASFGDEQTSVEHIWLWRLGDAALCAIPCEAYSLLQTRLRQEFSGRPVLVLNIGNGSLGYLPPRALYDHNVYTVWQTPFGRGGLEAVMDAALQGLRELERDAPTKSGG